MVSVRPTPMTDPERKEITKFLVVFGMRFRGSREAHLHAETEADMSVFTFPTREVCIYFCIIFGRTAV